MDQGCAHSSVLCSTTAEGLPDGVTAVAGRQGETGTYEEQVRQDNTTTVGFVGEVANQL